jgi:hypothetical protein
MADGRGLPERAVFAADADRARDPETKLTEDDSELLEFPMPLVITAGDPAGIGPEVTHRAVRLLQRRKQILQERPVAVIGDAWLYARMLKR